MGWKIGLGILVLYGLTLGAATLWLHRLVFLPEPAGPDQPYVFEVGSEDIWLEPEPGMRIHGLFFPGRKDSPAGLILYFHGNADNLQRWGTFVRDFLPHGYAVMMIDYPGYGRSEGHPSEALVYQSAEAAMEWALERYAVSQITVYGRSLGCAPATRIAAEYPVRQLILETPFFSMEELLKTRFPLIFRVVPPDVYFPVNEDLPAVTCPVAVFMGNQDRIVPPVSTNKLRPLLKPGDEWIVIPGGKHKNLSTFPQYHEELARLIGN